VLRDSPCHQSMRPTQHCPPCSSLMCCTCSEEASGSCARAPSQTRLRQTAPPASPRSRPPAAPRTRCRPALPVAAQATAAKVIDPSRCLAAVQIDHTRHACEATRRSPAQSRRCQLWRCRRPPSPTRASPGTSGRRQLQHRCTVNREDCAATSMDPTHACYTHVSRMAVHRNRPVANSRGRLACAKVEFTRAGWLRKLSPHRDTASEANLRRAIVTYCRSSTIVSK